MRPYFSPSRPAPLEAAAPSSPPPPFPTLPLLPPLPCGSPPGRASPTHPTCVLAKWRMIAPPPWNSGDPSGAWTAGAMWGRSILKTGEAGGAGLRGNRPNTTHTPTAPRQHPDSGPIPPFQPNPPHSGSPGFGRRCCCGWRWHHHYCCRTTGPPRPRPHSCPGGSGRWQVASSCGSGKWLVEVDATGCVMCEVRLWGVGMGWWGGRDLQRQGWRSSEPSCASCASTTRAR